MFRENADALINLIELLPIFTDSVGVFVKKSNITIITPKITPMPIPIHGIRFSSEKKTTKTIRIPILIIEFPLESERTFSVIQFVAYFDVEFQKLLNAKK